MMLFKSGAFFVEAFFDRDTSFLHTYFSTMKKMKTPTECMAVENKPTPHLILDFFIQKKTNSIS
jgi:hypothetical protein